MLVIVLFVVVIFLQPSAVLCEAEVIEWVQRRRSGDFYRVYKGSELHRNCDRIKATYLVDENQCVDDQQLLKRN